ncbi:DUF3487 family protein [Motilimonas cestriensis]|uniref:DUF3487 family protein n=1 Tax=Motilimonas cestriensis TaxID=2742685 RepID=UPI003DA4F9EE
MLVDDKSEIDFLLDGMDYEPTIVAGFTQTELFISAAVGAVVLIPIGMILLAVLGVSPLLGVPFGLVATAGFMFTVSKWLKFKKRNGKTSEMVYAELEVLLKKKYDINVGNYQHIIEKSCWDTERTKELKRIYQEDEEDE